MRAAHVAGGVHLRPTSSVDRALMTSLLSRGRLQEAMLENWCTRRMPIIQLPLGGGTLGMARRQKLRCKRLHSCCEERFDRSRSIDPSLGQLQQRGCQQGLLCR